MERSNNEEPDQIDLQAAHGEEEPVSEPARVEEFQSDEWWRVSASESDWAEPASNATASESKQEKPSGTADPYFCGRTTLFPLNLAIRAIGTENLTGLLR